MGQLAIIIIIFVPLMFLAERRKPKEAIISLGVLV